MTVSTTLLCREVRMVSRIDNDPIAPHFEAVFVDTRDRPSVSGALTVRFPTDNRQGLPDPATPLAPFRVGSRWTLKINEDGLEMRPAGSMIA